MGLNLPCTFFSNQHTTPATPVGVQQNIKKNAQGGESRILTVFLRKDFLTSLIKSKHIWTRFSARGVFLSFFFFGTFRLGTLKKSVGTLKKVRRHIKKKSVGTLKKSVILIRNFNP